MSSLDRQDTCGKRCQHRAASGQIIACAQIACIFRLDNEFLDHIRFVAPERGALGKIIKMQVLLLVDVEFSRLRPLRRTGPLTAFLPRCPGFQEAGLDFWTWLLSLEPSDLVPQLLNS